VFVGAKDFCPNSPKLAQKISKKGDLQTKLGMRFWAPFFSNQSGLSATFAHIFKEIA